ncbi:hypothetical protein AALO_G00267280 [Alosa alosa]|uniref:Uncharacterized protein n=1 Tax=Alosa alosa TaxID=278164 RepID=A0AAV6FME2_9TELE|nr:hypothetical protein AALO_G00267280 [Alosa alosa]
MLEKKQVNREVKQAIKKAKAAYKSKIEEKFTQGNLHEAWQGIKTMAAVNTVLDFRPVCVADNSEESLPNEFYSFYTRFDKDHQSQLADIISRLTPSDPITITVESVVECLKRTQIKKAPGPDHICGYTLKYCAEQLGGVFQQI